MFSKLEKYLINYASISQHLLYLHQYTSILRVLYTLHMIYLINSVTLTINQEMSTESLFCYEISDPTPLNQLYLNSSQESFTMQKEQLTNFH